MTGLLRAFSAALAVCAGLLAGPAQADGRSASGQQALSDLDTCLADDDAVLAIYRGRFPHDACAPLSACDPWLVVSAQILAEQACQIKVMDSCVAGADPALCLLDLAARWRAEAEASRGAALDLWRTMDQARAPRLLQRAMTRDETLAPTQTCPQSAPFDVFDVPGDVICTVYGAVSDRARYATLLRRVQGASR